MRGSIDSVRKSENQHCLSHARDNENELSPVHLDVQDDLKDD